MLTLVLIALTISCVKEPIAQQPEVSGTKDPRQQKTTQAENQNGGDPLAEAWTRLSEVQRQAFDYTAVKEGNKYAITIQQMNLFRIQFSSAFALAYLGEPGMATRYDEPESVAEVLRHLPTYPLFEAGSTPWPIVESGTSPPQAEVYLGIGESSGRLEGSIHSYQWDPYPPKDLFGFGAYQTAGGYEASDQAAGLRKNPDDFFYYALAARLTDVLNAYYLYWEAQPAVPSEAFHELGFALLDPALTTLLTRFPKAQFLRSTQDAAWGLLLEAGPEDQILLYKSADSVFKGNTMEPVNLFKPERQRLQDLVSKMDLWESVQDMPVPHLLVSELLNPAEEED